MRTHSQVIEAALYDLLAWAEAKHAAEANTDDAWPDEIVEAQQALIEKSIKISVPMLAMLRAAPIEGRIISPKTTWTSFVRSRVITATVKHPIAKKLLLLQVNEQELASATLTDAGRKAVHENRLF